MNCNYASIQKILKTKKGITALLLVALIGWYIGILPSPLFDVPYSTVLLDADENLLSATVAKDEQWRFPLKEDVPEKFVTCLLLFEDKYFYWHWGVNPISILRALKQNLAHGRIVSGGSTITMQVVRLFRKKPRRTIMEKCIEIMLATRLEWSYTKKEILCLYAAHVPFGGNVVGLEAAAWRYFGRNASQLSWAESATLAVLPNAPSLVFPGKNQEKLLQKRNRLLDKLLAEKIIDTLTWKLSLLEPLPQKPLPLPSHTPHLLTRVINEGKEGTFVRTTIRLHWQKAAQFVVEKHHQYLSGNEIHNAALLLAEVESGNVLAYVGNTSHPNNEHQNEVDIITALRSTGSLLKPFLFASMQQEGMLLPQTLVDDIPVCFSGGYMPKNFDKSYDGVVPAQTALTRSLNIPAVLMLQNYGIARFQEKLKALGMTTLKKSPDHYGLSLILGGAEGTLWEMTGIYASMARTLQYFHKSNGKYSAENFRPLSYLPSTSKKGHPSQEIVPPLDAASIWLTFETLKSVTRPREEQGWQIFTSGRPIAWKTGTSFGFRDAWAIGVSPHYVIGVWVGNANGEGRPGLTGLNCAAPILFDIFRQLDESDWFSPPYDELIRMPICRQSGYLALLHCSPVDTVWVHRNGERMEACPYHKIIHLDAYGRRVNSLCVSTSEMKVTSWFVLPPLQEWYYKQKNLTYQPLPPFAQGCEKENIFPFALVYPKEKTQI
ncbi:MAG: penicillin-binding protein 1C, partial [Flammeovirgaceae bacterium]|nr:penicillin-binding protein 1C [Flammeovirgaceae bacterium]MDW8287387.1 penicillin-binding protein 1C [Flammeovirgaceae bacterium]